MHGKTERQKKTEERTNKRTAFVNDVEKNDATFLGGGDGLIEQNWNDVTHVVLHLLAVSIRTHRQILHEKNIHYGLPASKDKGPCSSSRSLALTLRNVLFNVPCHLSGTHFLHWSSEATHYLYLNLG